jgi:anthranilate/para-aminobenzoate synthase component II
MDRYGSLPLTEALKSNIIRCAAPNPVTVQRKHRQGQHDALQFHPRSYEPSMNWRAISIAL